MYNVLLSVAVGLTVYAGLFVPGVLKSGESAAPAVLAFMVAYFLLARRSFKQLEARSQAK